MYLIVWLWNPGKEYIHTRHNVGYMFVDFFEKKYSFSSFSLEKKFQWMVSEWNYNGEKILLLKPTTYMNLSGESIKKVCDFYKIPLQNWIVVFDDISMEFWKIRLRDTWSAGGHNGVKSIISYFWEMFNRVKFWVDLHPHFEVSDWVLSKFTKEELLKIEESLLDKIEEAVASFIKNK